MRRCKRCGKRLARRADEIRWLLDDDTDGPPLCEHCYEFIVDHYDEGMTEEELSEIIKDFSND